MVALFVSVSSYANDTVIPAWACNLNFKAHAQGFQIIVGKFDVKGRGVLRCVSAFEVRTIPVSINMSTKYLAPRVAMGSYDVYGETTQIGLFAYNPEDLLGTYLIAEGQGTLVAGAGAMTAIRATIPHISMQLSVQFVRGFGLNAGVTTMTIAEI